MECDTTGALALLNGMQLGNSAITRVGAQILIKSLQINMIFPNDQATTSAGRYMVFVDRQTNGTAMTLAQVLNNTNTIGLRNLDNRRRFKCLCDRTVVCAPVNTDGSVKCRKLFIRFRRGLRVEYNIGNAGTVADIAANSLYFVTSGAIANPAGLPLAAWARIRFLDL